MEAVMEVLVMVLVVAGLVAIGVMAGRLLARRATPAPVVEPSPPVPVEEVLREFEARAAQDRAAQAA
ncbi:MAG: hypothetical protein WEB19_03830, partial [Acidimicrobiia bacterium]